MFNSDFDESDLRDKLRIDRDNLDFEIVAQPEYYYHAGNACAEAVSRRDQAYELIKQTDASLYIRIRTMVEDKGMKVTETLLTNMVIIEDDHVEANRNWVEAKGEADSLAVLRDSFQQRGYMLRDLVQLIVTGYYSEKPMNGDSPHVAHFRQESRESRVRDAKRQRLEGKE